MATAAVSRQREETHWHGGCWPHVNVSASSTENPLSGGDGEAVDSLAAFPVKLDAELCWDSRMSSKDYVVHLTTKDLESIDAAVAKFKECGLAIPMICPDNFPLPESLIKTLRSLSGAVHNGRGFVVLRGLKPNTKDQSHNVISFCGLLSHVGIDRSTNANNMAMDHLRDASKDPRPHDREHVDLHPSKMMAPLKYHADRDFADVVALFVNSKAASGGQQRLSSFWTAYNQMMESCPDVLRVLAENFPWPGVVNEEPATTYTPVMFHQSGKVFCQLVYRVFEGLNILNDKQWDALNVFETYAEQNSIGLDVEEGDIQLINNLALHGRRAWVDIHGKKRHYFRVGLRDPQMAWPRPETYEWLFDKRYQTPTKDQVVPITDFDPYGLTSLGADHG